MTMSDNWVYLSYPWGPSCPAYAGGTGLEFKPLNSIKDGASSNSLEIKGPNHIGTHFDFPRHFDERGKSVLDYPPEAFMHKRCLVFWLDMMRAQLLEIEALEQKLEFYTGDYSESIVLIRTGAGLYRHEPAFWKEGPGLGLGLAGFLRSKFPRLTTVGMDCISVSSLAHRETGRLVHREFLCEDRPLLLIEDMNLEPLAGKGVREVLSIPLRIENGDGAPCTVLAKLEA